MMRAPRRAGVRAGFALLGLLLSLGAGSLAAQDLPSVPKLSARVTDLTGTLTAEQQTALEQKLAAFEAAKGSQLAVLIVPSTAPETLEQFSIRVVDQWKLGRKGTDDGALLLIATKDRGARIEVGRGLEGVLTDAMSHRLISETLAPALRQGNFYGGIDGTLDQMMKLIEGEPLPPPDHAWQSSRSRGGANLLPVMFAIFIGSVLLRAIFGRTLGSAFTGAGAGFLVWLAGYALAFAGLAAAGAFLFTLLGGLTRGSGWSSTPRGGGLGGGWGGMGGGLGGFGGGGFGGGGFSGGGGGFAGGGASGSW